MFLKILKILIITGYCISINTSFGESTNYPCNDLETLKKQAENDDDNAQYYFAKCLINNNQFEEAVKWLKGAAEDGHELAQISLGHCYYLGKGGLKKNEKTGLRWYQAAAEQDNKWALYFLAEHYTKYGRYEKAVPLYKEAADKTHISSVIALARYYTDIKKDPKKAEYWFDIAKQFGYDSNIKAHPNRW